MLSYINIHLTKNYFNPPTSKIFFTHFLLFPTSIANFLTNFSKFLELLQTIYSIVKLINYYIWYNSYAKIVGKLL